MFYTPGIGANDIRNSSSVIFEYCFVVNNVSLGMSSFFYIFHFRFIVYLERIDKHVKIVLIKLNTSSTYSFLSYSGEIPVGGAIYVPGYGFSI